MMRNGVKPEVLAGSPGKVVVRVGPYDITFVEGPDGRARKRSVFFQSTRSYIDWNPPSRLFMPAARRANVVLADRRKRRIQKEFVEKRQLTLPFKT